MPDRDIAGALAVYIADVRALLPALDRHIAALGADIARAQRAAMLARVCHLASTIAELSVAFHVVECAVLAATMAEATAPDAHVEPAPEALSDAAAYFSTRLDALERGGAEDTSGQYRPASHLELARLLARFVIPETELAQAHALASSGATLSQEDAAIVRAFQAGTLKRGPHAGPAHDNAADDEKVPLVGGPSAGAADPDALTDDMRELFLSEVGSDLEDLRRTLLNFEELPSDRAPLETAAMLAHKIKGVAAMLAFPAFVDLIHLWEAQIALLSTQHVEASPRTAGILVSGLEQLAMAYAAIARGQDPASDSLSRMRALAATLRDAGSQRNGASINPAGDAIPLGSAFGSGVDATVATPSTPALGGLHNPLDEPMLRVDLRRMDELSRRIGALSANRGELAHARAAVAEMQSEMERTLARLGELSARLTDARPIAATPPAFAPSFTSLPYKVARLLATMPGSETMPPASAAATFGLPTTHETPLTASRAPDVLQEPDVPEVERYTELDQLTFALGETIADATASGDGLRAALARFDGLSEAQEGLAVGIQQAIMRVRLVPLNERILPLHRIARQLAAEQGKAVKLSVRGEMTEIDREVSEGLGEALAHLVRNAIVHGIEPPDERLARGKPAAGEIWIYAYYTGNEVNIQINDDGRGMDPNLLIDAARASGLIDADTAGAMRPADALNLIFEHGFTTVTEATAAAGRGIGMAGVATSLARLHGAIDVRSNPGQGTRFHIRVPTSLSTVRALEVRAAGQTYIVPAAVVHQMVPLSPPEAIQNAQSGGRRLRIAIDHDDIDLPLYSMAELLGLPYVAAPRGEALVVELGHQRAAIAVERVIAESEVVVRALPPHLQRRAIRGATVTPDGEVRLVLDLPDLVARVVTEGYVQPASPIRTEVASNLERPAILVVDDSLTIRRSLQATLTHAGFAVRTAVDGMEALDAVLRTPPRVLILDIEMPRLDGYELLSLLRARKDLASVRVAMLTSKGTERHRRHAELLGADAFLVKPCTDEELLATVERLLALSAQ